MLQTSNLLPEIATLSNDVSPGMLLPQQETAPTINTAVATQNLQSSPLVQASFRYPRSHPYFIFNITTIA